MRSGIETTAMTRGPEPQLGIVPEPADAAHFLVLRVRDHVCNAREVGRQLSAIPALMAELDPGERLAANVGIGPEFWDALSPGRRPAGLRPFRALAADGRRAPSTGGDVLLHVSSARRDLTFDLLLQARTRLGDQVEVLEDVAAFRRFEARDLTGFIDGTENPKDDARAEWALVGDDDAPFAGGSYVFTQRYVHDLKRWAEAPLKEQEGAIGRRKRDSKQLSEKSTPPTAHISRVVIEEPGPDGSPAELEIFRRSAPWGTVTEHGLYFVAFSADPTRFDKMLAKMFGTTGDGLHDRLTDFSRPVSGSYYFAPSLESLAALGE